MGVNHFQNLLFGGLSTNSGFLEDEEYDYERESEGENVATNSHNSGAIIGTFFVDFDVADTNSDRDGDFGFDTEQALE